MIKKLIIFNIKIIFNIMFLPINPGMAIFCNNSENYSTKQ